MTIDQAAQVIWNYMLMHDTPKKADAIFLLCSSDIRVADRGAELFHEGYSDLVIVSGGFGVLTKSIFKKPEAEVFKDALLAAGVSEGRMIIENNSTNTGENIHFTYQLLKDMGKSLHSFILVQKPYMERRTYATFKKQWPDKTAMISVTSPVLSYEEYMQGEGVDKDMIINIMVGDLQRIREYPGLGFQIEQKIPKEVDYAYGSLVAAGYTKHLI